MSKLVKRPSFSVLSSLNDEDTEGDSLHLDADIALSSSLNQIPEVETLLPSKSARQLKKQRKNILKNVLAGHGSRDDFVNVYGLNVCAFNF